MTEAQKKANKKWDAKNIPIKYDKMTIQLPKGTKEIIKNNAQKYNLSINKYLFKLITEDLAGEN